MKEIMQSNLLDFQDPGPLPSELMDAPGFVNALKSHTLANAARTNETLAFAGALAMLAHLSGRACRDRRGTRTNLYLAALADTGFGKDEPRCVNKSLAAAVGILHSTPDAIASGEGLEDAMAASPSLLLQADEADALLTAIRGGDSRASRLNEMILRFFSEAKSSHAMRLRAGDTEARLIPAPHLTLFATGIPKFFYRALTEKALQNGLVGRCLFFETEEFAPIGPMRNEPLPEAALATARRLAARERTACETGVIEPLVVEETPEAFARFRSFCSSCDETTRRLHDSNLLTAAALYVRLAEKTAKLAMLHALSRDNLAPRMTEEDVTWAARLATHLTRRMLYMAQFHVSEGKFDRLKKRFLAALAQNGGEMSRSELLKRLHVDVGTFKKTAQTLRLCEMIDEEVVSRNKVIYTLKSAA